MKSDKLIRIGVEYEYAPSGLSRDQEKKTDDNPIVNMVDWKPNLPVVCAERRKYI